MKKKLFFKRELMIFHLFIRVLLIQSFQKDTSSGNIFSSSRNFQSGKEMYGWAAGKFEGKCKFVKLCFIAHEIFIVWF